jgi:hypothetical protein
MGNLILRQKQALQLANAKLGAVYWIGVYQTYYLGLSENSV